MPESRSLHRKLAQVMYEAERIPKRGKAPAAMGGFEFVQVGDAADFIRKALAEKLITMMPTHVQIVGQSEHETKSGGSMTVVDLITDWTLTDGESGEQIVIQSFGAGADAGDKYSGKAQTNAMKYALLMGFLLSTGDDPELSDSSDRQPRRSRGVEEMRAAPAVERGSAAARAAARSEVIGAYIASDALTGDQVKPVLDALSDRPGDPDGLTGTVEVGKNDADFELRQTPDGHRLGFRLVSKSGGIKVMADRPLAEELRAYRDQVVGALVTCWGRISDESFRPKGSQREVSYQVLNATRVRVPGLGDLPLPVEAEMVPLFTPEEEAELDAALP